MYFKLGEKVTVHVRKFGNALELIEGYIVDYHGCIGGESWYGVYLHETSVQSSYPESSLSRLNNKSITESKPKWSVGTYVEFLKNCDFEEKGQICEITEEYTYENWHGDNEKRIMMKVVNCDQIYTKSIMSCDTDLYCGKIKWHENKPEEKVRYVDPQPMYFDGGNLNPYYADEVSRYDKPQQPIYASNMKVNNDGSLSNVSITPEKLECSSAVLEGLKRHESFWAEGSNEVFDFSKCTTSNEKTMDEYRDLLQSGKIKLSDVIEEWEKNNRLIGEESITEYPLTPKQAFIYPNKASWDKLLYGSSFLIKPQIHISKQKQIKLNINKPKI